MKRGDGISRMFDTDDWQTGAVHVRKRQTHLKLSQNGRDPLQKIRNSSKYLRYGNTHGDTSRSQLSRRKRTQTLYEPEAALIPIAGEAVLFTTAHSANSCLLNLSKKEALMVHGAGACCRSCNGSKILHRTQ